MAKAILSVTIHYDESKTTADTVAEALTSLLHRVLESPGILVDSGLQQVSDLHDVGQIKYAVYDSDNDHVVDGQVYDDLEEAQDTAERFDCTVLHLTGFYEPETLKEEDDGE